MVNQKLLHYLITIAEEKNISKAARKLYISQPSLSIFLKRTEEQLGIKLFDRFKNSITPTIAGQKYIEGLQDIVLQEKRLYQEMQEHADHTSGVLSFGITNSKSYYILPRVLPLYMAMFPNIKVNIVQNNNEVLLHQVYSGNIDVAFINYTYTLPNLTYVELQGEIMQIITSPDHPLSRQRQITANNELPPLHLKSIYNEPFIYLTKGHGVRNMVDNIFYANGGNFPPSAYEVSNNATAYALVSVGLGISILPDNFFRYIEKNNSITRFSIADGNFFRKVAICYRSTFNMPSSLISFIDLVRDTVNKMDADT